MAKITGFNHITEASFIKAYQWIIEEGTCCLAYGDWTKAAETLLLTPEQQELRKGDNDTAWGEMDIEVIEAIVMLPVLKMLDTTTLYWCASCKSISAVPIDCDCPELERKFGLDFTSHEGHITFISLDELSAYCAHACVEAVVIVNVTMTYEDGANQRFTWYVATALDYNMLEAAISAAVTLADGENTKVSYTFEVK